MYCDATKESEQSKLGQQIMNGQDPLGDKLPTPGNAPEVDLPTLSADGWMGGGSCFQDKSVSVHGMALTIPFSSVCPYLLPIRAAVMLIAALASFRMLSGTVLKE